MGSRRAAVPAMWWRTIFALSVAASCTPSTLGAYYEGGGGGGRLLLGFQEVKGNASYQCSPSGPCLPCQYSEKVRVIHRSLLFFCFCSSSNRQLLCCDSGKKNKKIKVPFTNPWLHLRIIDKRDVLFCFLFLSPGVFLW